MSSNVLLSFRTFGLVSRCVLNSICNPSNPREFFKLLFYKKYLTDILIFKEQFDAAL